MSHLTYQDCCVIDINYSSGLSRFRNVFGDLRPSWPGAPFTPGAFLPRDFPEDSGAETPLDVRMRGVPGAETRRNPRVARAPVSHGRGDSVQHDDADDPEAGTRWCGLGLDSLAPGLDRGLLTQSPAYDQIPAGGDLIRLEVACPARSPWRPIDLAPGLAWLATTIWRLSWRGCKTGLADARGHGI